MAVTLGKDCSITGIGNAIVRSVNMSLSASTIESHPFGQREVVTQSIGYTRTIEVECVDDPNLWASLQSGAVITLNASGVGGSFVVTNIARNEPLDDVVTVTVTAKGSS